MMQVHQARLEFLMYRQPLKYVPAASHTSHHFFGSCVTTQVVLARLPLEVFFHHHLEKVRGLDFRHYLGPVDHQMGLVLHHRHLTEAESIRPAFLRARLGRELCSPIIEVL